jgi:hypothetical protein
MRTRKPARIKRVKKQRTGTRPARRRRDPRRTGRSLSNAEQLKRLQKWLLPNDRIFASLCPHGNTKWGPTALVWLALCWGWAEPRHVTDAFQVALDRCRVLGIPTLSTYQGFMNALVTWTDHLMRLLWPVLHQHMEHLGTFWQIGGWVAIAFDGSRGTAPRTESNERALCASHYGQGKTAKYRKKKSRGMRRRKNERCKAQPQGPQVWVTLLWYMGLRLPWMWRLGPSNSSERTHVKEMLDAGSFPKKTLFCGDAGFIGYALWAQILGGGHDFLVRVGANVNLLADMADYRMQNGLVLCWPKAAMQAGQAPLRLRLVRAQIGTTWMWMLTSVLDPSKLTTRQIAEFYEMRWGIELEFRGLKQTLDRSKLCCRNDRRVLAELNWSIMAMAVAELFALKEQLAARRSPRSDPPPDPKKRSLAKTMSALRRSLNNLEWVPEAGNDLPTRLRLAVTDSYVRKASKHARYRPRNPDKKHLGNPRIRKLTAEQKTILDAISPQKLVA